LACCCVRGVGAKADGEPGAALAGAIRTEAPIEDMKKRRLIEIALIDIFLDTFDILSKIRQ